MEEEEGDPFRSTGSETMEEPKIPKTRERNVSDVIDSIGDCLPYASDHRIVSTPEKFIGNRGPDSSVSLGYDSVDSGTPKSPVSPDSDAYPPPPKKALKMPQVDVTDGSAMSQDYVMSPSGTYEAVMPVKKDGQEYNMNHKRRGKAVIFNHEEFKHEDPRPGSAVDVRILKETYGALGFEVIIYKNLKTGDIDKAVTELAAEDHSDADCLLVTVLTHGKTSSLLAAYDTYYKYEDLWEPFTADKCPSLAGKPKIFVFQACRGKETDSGVTMKQGRTCMETDAGQTEYKIPNYADFLLANSSARGLSFRHIKDGTWFIQSLCEELQKHGSSKHFVDILTRTSRRVAVEFESFHNDPSKHQKKQVPSFYSTLIRDIYFSPKT